jgi:hypothetical protein
MKNLIALENNILRISPEALVVKEFHDIWKRDKTKTKGRALKELAYIYHSTDYQSIYRNYHPSNRESKIKLDVFGDKEHPLDSLIILAKDKYVELQTTLSMELLADAEIGLTKLRDYFRDVDFSEDESGTVAKNFMANLKQLGDVVKGMKSLREEVEKELSDSMQLRGGSTIGNRELPKERRG